MEEAVERHLASRAVAAGLGPQEGWQAVAVPAILMLFMMLCCS